MEEFTSVLGGTLNVNVHVYVYVLGGLSSMQHVIITDMYIQSILASLKGGGHGGRGEG